METEPRLGFKIILISCTLPLANSLLAGVWPTSDHFCCHFGWFAVLAHRQLLSLTDTPGKTKNALLTRLGIKFADHPQPVTAAFDAVQREPANGLSAGVVGG